MRVAVGTTSSSLAYLALSPHNHSRSMFGSLKAGSTQRSRPLAPSRYLSGNPYTGIPVTASGNTGRVVAQARVRAWPERNQTRVIVFAVGESSARQVS